MLLKMKEHSIWRKERESEDEFDTGIQTNPEKSQDN